MVIVSAVSVLVTIIIRRISRNKTMKAQKRIYKHRAWIQIPKCDLFPEGYSSYVESSLPENGRLFHDIDNMDGHSFEYWCADLLRDNGFENVSVTQGSGDQGVDVLAEKDGVKYAIQCKCYSSDLGNKPVQEVHTGKEIYGCHVGVVMTNRHFTQGAIAAAKATRVMLWDREKILELMNTTKLSITNPPTVSQWETNALIAAKDYIKSDHYSYQELIEQLEYDGYTTKQATYAADNCGGDWFSQAERAAKSYLSTDLFSPSELIEQLELDGFTHDQAQYAISCIN